MLTKLKRDNVEIEKAIGKMYQSILKRNIDPKVVKYADPTKPSQEDSFIAVEYGLDECEELMELEELTEDLLMHMIEITDSLFIIAELDGKPCYSVNVKERKQLKNNAAVEYF